MRTSETTTQTVNKTKWTVTCDCCGASAKRKCKACEKDICEACSTFWSNDPFDGDDNGDYWTDVCRDCDADVQEIGKQSRDLMQAAWERMDKTKTEWYDLRRKRIFMPII